LPLLHFSKYPLVSEAFLHDPIYNSNIVPHNNLFSFMVLT
jgi:hypothetical protein